MSRYSHLVDSDGNFRPPSTGERKRSRMANFHERAARAYREIGDTDNAEIAERYARNLRDETETP